MAMFVRVIAESVSLSQRLQTSCQIDRVEIEDIIRRLAWAANFTVGVTEILTVTREAERSIVNGAMALIKPAGAESPLRPCLRCRTSEAGPNARGSHKAFAYISQRDHKRHWLAR